MWHIHTIICIINISIQPFCSYGGKLPITFTNYNSCDIAIDRIVEKIDEDLKFKEVALLMKCIESYEQTHT
jgi:hypothetical protein|tara:strand:- start:1713 stop:1925 length:213 start_codon:yes stop_codon:yes gene_type:complete